MNTVFLEKICRCCLNESDNLTNFTDQINIGEDENRFEIDSSLTYLDAMYLCTNLRYDVDLVDANDQIIEFPKAICDDCLLELRAALRFRAKCETSDNLLREQTIDCGNSQVALCDSLEVDFVAQPIDAKKTNELIEIASHPKITELNVPDVQSKQSECNEKNVVLEIALNKSPNLSDEIKENIQSSPQQKMYKCNKCTKSFFTERGLEMHSVRYHCTTQKIISCSICSQVFATKQRLTLHTYTHTGEKKFKCDVCERSFATGATLKSHKRVHTGERPFKCSECNLTFSQSNALKCHKRIHTGDRPYECEYCYKRFTQKTILKTHLTLHTGKTIKCPDCDKMFSRSSYLILHRREHTGEKPYVCSQCPNRYKQKSHLDRHMDTHLGVKHTCDVCQKVYSKRWSLKQHMFTHSGTKPFQCEICNAEFVRKDKYKNHLNMMHEKKSIKN